MDVIKASEAKKIAMDTKRQANTLAKEAVDEILKELDEKVKKESLLCNFQTELSLNAINRLNEINIEAAKQVTFTISHKIFDLGYKTKTFTNYTQSITIYWD